MASAIGGWMASAGIAKLVDQACCYAGDQYKYQRDDAKEKLRRLENSLWKIKAVVQRAESLQTKNQSMESWLGNIKDAAYDAEDVLDLFDYRVLEAKSENMAKMTTYSSDYSTAGSSSSITSTTTITTGSTTTSSSTVTRSVRLFRRFLFSNEDLNELIAIVGRFDKIAIEMPIFLDLVKLEEMRPEQSTQWRVTTSMVGTTKFFGRVAEEKQLKNLIAQANGESNLPYSVIPIVGIAGVGKTALLQRVYSHFRDTGHFDFMAWIHVSEKFEVERLTKEMVESEKCRRLKRKRDVTIQVSWHGSKSADWNNNSSLDQNQRKLQYQMSGKKILVVFDDVWNEMSSQWENLCKPLQFARKGSKVVITTRSQKVAKINGAEEIMHLDGLKDDEYCRHFMQCAFGNVTPAEFPRLEAIGQLLAKRLAGSPLAAKTVGGNLKLRLHEHHWRAVLGSKLWHIEQKEDDIIPALRLSYERLQDHLKQCFVYFALFPKNYPFHGGVLIQMWRAQGYIEKETNDESAHSYIEDLLQLSFIQKAANLDYHYVVHDLLHDLAEWISSGEHFRIEDDFQVSIPGNVRHLYVNASNISKVFISLRESEVKKNLRSLIICKHDTVSGEGIPPCNFNKALQETLQMHELRSLRVFVLRHPDGMLPDNIEHLVHLRYIDINESIIFTDVPRSLFKLYHLQGLTLQSSYNYKTKVELQKGINSLTQLRYLKAPLNIVSGIERIGRLTSLHELEEYHVTSDNTHSITQLKELNELRGKLRIKNLEHVNCREANEAILMKNQNLKKLSFCWTHFQESNSNTEHEGVFEGLRPNCNLREMNVTSYMGAKSPNWLTREYLPNIETIELVSCHHWKTLPPFGSLPFLRVLRIRRFTALEKIDAGFYGDTAVAFPSLEELSIGHMKQWKEWSGIESNQCIFPRLHDICIKNCQQLIGPFPLPVSSKGINIYVSDWLSASMSSTSSENATNDSKEAFGIRLILDCFGLLLGCIQSSGLPTIHVLELSSYQLVSFSKEQEEWLQKLTSVKEIRFNDCAKLTSLPSNLVRLTSLRYLYIEKCPELKLFPQMGLPLSLKKLSIIRCHNNLSELGSQIKIGDIMVIPRDIKRESKLSNEKKNNWI
ncbi:hypothetical protein ACP4OV_030427 [Aristida adscensionis]